MRRLIVIFTAMMCISVSSFAESFSVNLHQVKLLDLARVVYGDILKVSYIMQSEFLQDTAEVSVNWQAVQSAQLEQLTRDLIHAKGFEVSKSAGVLTIRKTSLADDELLLYQVKYRSVKYLTDILAKVAQKQPLGGRALPAPTGQAVGQSTQAPASLIPEVVGAASSNFDRSALDQLAYSCSPVECARLRKLLAQLDTAEANVMLRAVIYEVQTSHSDGSALQLAANIARGKLGANMGSTIAGAASFTLTAGGFNAIVSMLDSDSRFNSLSRPSLRVKTGSTAKFSVGSQVPILGAVSQDKNGNPVQSVDYRPAGTIFTVIPDIRGEVIDLNVTQELSSFAVTTVGLTNSPTLLQRLASSTLSLKDSEVVVFAGLEETKDDKADGKLLGLFPLSTKSNKSKSEILLFIEAQKI